MLYKLTANHSSFKSIVFSKGLNIILGERTASSGEKDSRNTLGKTTFIEIIDFCLGSDFTKQSKLYAPELEDWAFTLELEIFSYRFEVTRYINNDKKIYIHPFSSTFPIELKQSKDKTTYIDLSDWKLFLGKHLFNIPIFERKQPYIPSARSILGYFIRKSGGYNKPFETFKNEKSIQIKINNAFVLNLLWEKSLELHNLLVEMDKYGKLITLYKEVGNTPGKLNTQMVILSDEIISLRKNIEDFNVLPEYNDIQSAANNLTKKIQQLNNFIILNQKKLDEYKLVIADETTNTDFDIVQSMYKEAQVIFSDNIIKTLEDVKTFNEVIVKNRKEFLQEEIKKLQIDINRAHENVKKYSDERAEKMKLLSAHGALDEYSLLQEKLSKKMSALEILRLEKEKQENAQKEVFSKKSIKDQLKYEISNNISTNENLKEEISIFNKNSMQLYDMSANLVVDIDRNGNYKYSISREKSSEGVERMNIFCYDMMLIEMYKKNLIDGIDFLIHDSTIYDAVDSRQRALAIELAQSKSSALGFQYIFTINSDLLPLDDFSQGFDYSDYVVCRLNDGDISGSLLGITYSSPIGDDLENNV